MVIEDSYLRSFDARMDEKQQNDTENLREAGSPRIYETVEGEALGYGEPCVYSYRLVYTQESLWVLDMRPDPTMLQPDSLFWRILRARARGAGYTSVVHHSQCGGRVIVFK